jgi:hypothetical protein
MKASIAIFLACLLGLSFAHQFGNAAQAMVANAALGLMAVLIYWAVNIFVFFTTLLSDAFDKWRMNRS